MCGIFAYLAWEPQRSMRDALDVLFRGLKRLEYRGYDSAGLALETPAPPPPALSVPFLVRECGKIANLEEKVRRVASESFLEGRATRTVGISHTRWATHGPPAENNAHPQVSDGTCEFVVVHNGIITNFRPIKEVLVREGFHFESDTDTEVIPKLCKFIFDRLSSSTKPPFKDIVMEVMRKIEGAFSLLVMSKHYPGELVACKLGSPLILGIKEGPTPAPADDAAGDTDMKISSSNGAMKKRAASSIEYFLASDASAIVEHTKKVLVLEDGDVAHLHDGAHGIFQLKPENADGVNSPRGILDGVLRVPNLPIERVVNTLQMEVEQIMKGSYDHFMQKEIHEQPESVTQTMRGRISLSPTTMTTHTTGVSWRHEERPVVLGGILEYASAIRRSRRITFIACGTSYNSCLAARRLMEEMTEIPVTLEIASDFMDRQCPIFRDDTCIFVSQSGETADTLEALKYAKEQGALCVGITNTVGSAISRSTACGIHVNAGCEIGVASTKAYTSQIIAITMMSLLLAEDSLAKRARRDEIIEGLRRLPSALRKTLKLDADMKVLAGNLESEQSLLVFGRGYNYATALEGALKVKEVALLHSEGLLAGEMKHGPLALVDERLPIVLIATMDDTYVKQQSVIQQLRARKAQLIIICNEDDDEMEEYPGCRYIRVPRVADCLQSVVNIVPLQLLAYHLTLARGFNVDQPRNLAKSVTTQ